jgi:hypothetical protein
MVDGLLLALLQQLPQAGTAADQAAKGWFTMQFSAGDITSVGTVIAAYVAIRERLARLETKVEPMWQAWNLRNVTRRRE